MILDLNISKKARYGIEKLKKIYFDGIDEGASPVPFLAFGNDESLLMIPEEVAIDIFDNRKNQFVFLAKKLIEKIHKDQGIKVDFMIIMTEVFYRDDIKVEDQEEYMKNHKPLRDDPISKEAAMIIVETKEEISTEIYALEYDTNAEDRKVNRSCKSDINSKKGTKDYKETVKNSKFNGIF